MARVIGRIQKRYPWDKWTDGKARRARRGADFQCTCDGFAQTLYSHATRHQLSVSLSVDASKELVDFQFAKN